MGVFEAHRPDPSFRHLDLQGAGREVLLRDKDIHHRPVVLFVVVDDAVREAVEATFRERLPDPRAQGLRQGLLMVHREAAEAHPSGRFGPGVLPTGLPIGRHELNVGQRVHQDRPLVDLDGGLRLVAPEGQLPALLPLEFLRRHATIQLGPRGEREEQEKQWKDEAHRCAEARWCLDGTRGESFSNRIVGGMSPGRGGSQCLLPSSVADAAGPRVGTGPWDESHG